MKNDLLNQIEMELASTLIRQTESGQINENQVSSIAKDILRVLPEHVTNEQLNVILTRLPEIYSEFSPISFKFAQILERNKTEDQLVKIRQKINNVLHGPNSRGKTTSKRNNQDEASGSKTKS